MAQTLDDVLARRIRALYLDARVAKEMAPKVVHLPPVIVISPDSLEKSLWLREISLVLSPSPSLVATELGKDQAWEEEQVNEFCQLADGYILQ